MKYILMFLLLIAIITIAFTISTLNNPTGFAIADIDEKQSNEKELPSFKIYTKAVCENISNAIVCQDELFAKCEGIEYKLPRNEVNGKGIFNKEWKDPRDN